MNEEYFNKHMWEPALKDPELMKQLRAWVIVEKLKQRGIELAQIFLLFVEKAVLVPASPSSENASSALRSWSTYKRELVMEM